MGHRMARLEHPRLGPWIQGLLGAEVFPMVEAQPRAVAARGCRHSGKSVLLKDRRLGCDMLRIQKGIEYVPWRIAGERESER